MTNSTKLTDIPGASEALPSELFGNSEYNNGRNDAVTLLGYVHLEVDVGAIINMLKISLCSCEPPILPDIDPGECCVFCYYSTGKDYRDFAEKLSTDIPKWARLVRK